MYLYYIIDIFKYSRTSILNAELYSPSEPFFLSQSINATQTIISKEMICAESSTFMPDKCDDNILLVFVINYILQQWGDCMLYKFIDGTAKTMYTENIHTI